MEAIEIRGTDPQHPEYDPYQRCPCGAATFGGASLVSGPLNHYGPNEASYSDQAYSPPLLLECHACGRTLVERAWIPGDGDGIQPGVMVEGLTMEVLQTLYQHLQGDPALDTAPDDVLEAMNVLTRATGSTYDWTAPDGEADH